MGTIDLLGSLSILGTAVFALTGAISAAKKRFDIFGMIVLAALVGLGGGTLRDVILGRLPVFWVRDPSELLNTTLVAVISFFALPWFERKKQIFLWADALGLATFAVVGTGVAIEQQVSLWLAPLFGVFSACFGGLLRDVIANDRPLILYGELYASAAFLGGVVYTLCFYWQWGHGLSVALALAVGLLMRAVGIIWKVHLPKPKYH